jgi:D-sedoheptulose 7-phosphate isomerase
MSDYQFIKSYLNDFSDLLKPNDELIEKLIQVRDLLLEVSQNKKKILIFGNGGSAAIASHFSVDLTKNARVRCLNFNEADLITCFANDYGFEHWAEKATDFYGDEGDLLIVISSSGRSQNMLNAVKAARNGNFKSVVTLSGFSEDNSLNQLGDINLWIDSKAYNFVENIHQAWLLTIVDLVIGKREYSA